MGREMLPKDQTFDGKVYIEPDLKGPKHFFYFTEWANKFTAREEFTYQIKLKIL